MIRILGIQRILILTILVALNLALGCFAYIYVKPHLVQKKSELEQTNAEIEALNADIVRVNVEYDEIQKQKGRFQALDKDGFFRDQSRRVAEDMLKRIQNSTKVITAVASIGAGKVIDNPEAAKAKYKVLESPMELRIEALDDKQIYNYLYILQKNFPGYLSYDNLELTRTGVLNATTLRGVASGSAVPLVKAVIRMKWRTMIPNTVAAAVQQTNPNSGGN